MIQRGLAALKDNRDYAGFRDAALARGRADWLIGMNFSRAYTLVRYTPLTGRHRRWAGAIAGEQGRFVSLAFLRS